MKIYILGICGTFMASIAILAKQLGHEVWGCDDKVYPPMDKQLSNQGIDLTLGFDYQHLSKVKPDIVIIGNVIKRGDEITEYLLNHGIPYTSGPQWLKETVLKDRHILAVAGTHGKTTTASMLAWILAYQHPKQLPGFLIGGIPKNFKVSAALGQSPYFVIEADEYDSAFFDKRSKFVHYHPHTCVLNNLEFDHADIFANIEEIKKQFHHLVRTIPGNGLIIYNHCEANLQAVLQQGCWSRTTTFNNPSAWHSKKITPEGHHFAVYFNGQKQGEIKWPLLGDHNISNALAAIAAASNVNIAPKQAIMALHHFKGIKRRMEFKNQVNGINIYEDFAHHPTAIATTLAGLRAKINRGKIIAIVELGSYSMRANIHGDALTMALKQANEYLIKRPQDSIDAIINKINPLAKPNDHIIIMSNKGITQLYERLTSTLS